MTAELESLSVQYEALQMQHKLAQANYDQKLDSLDLSLKDSKSAHDESVRAITSLQSSRTQLVRGK